MGNKQTKDLEDDCICKDHPEPITNIPRVVRGPPRWFTWWTTNKMNHLGEPRTHRTKALMDNCKCKGDRSCKCKADPEPAVPESSKEYPDKPKECNLECTKDRKLVSYVEYVGPVHISLVEPPGYVYRRTMLETALVNMAYLFMGSTVIIPLYYTLAFKLFWPVNLHILLATIGSQIFMPLYFLILNHLHGPGVYLKSQEKRVEASSMNFLGIVFVCIGSLCLLFTYNDCSQDYELDPVLNLVHSVSGVIGVLLCVLSFIASTFTISVDEKSKLGMLAQLSSIPAFLVLTVTFTTGLYKPGIVEWFPDKHMSAFLTTFCFIYTFIILYRPVRNVTGESE